MFLECSYFGIKNEAGVLKNSVLIRKKECIYIEFYIYRGYFQLNIVEMRIEMRINEIDHCYFHTCQFGRGNVSCQDFALIRSEKIHIFRFFRIEGKQLNPKYAVG